MTTQDTDFTPDEIHSTDWYILPPSADGKARFESVHDETDWVRVKLTAGCFGPRALDASTPADAWDYVSVYQDGARRGVILRSSNRRHADVHAPPAADRADVHDLRAAGRLLTADEYETRRRRAIALHKRMGGRRHGRSDYAEASLIAKRQIESLIQLDDREHERMRSVVLSARPGESHQPDHRQRERSGA
jgi:hypothetical protein